MALLTKETQDKVIKLLIDEGLANAEAIKSASAEVEKNKQPLIAYLTSKKIINNEMVAHATAVVIGVQYVDLKNVTMDREILLNLPQDVADRSMVVPVGEMGDQLVVAMIDVTNVQATDYLATLTGRPIKAVMSSEEGIRQVLTQYVGDFSSVKQAVKSTNAEIMQQQQQADVKTITQDSPISKALTAILDFAVKSKASDIHIEPLEESLVIRCRIDGVLRQVMELPKSIEPALVSRIKILAIFTVN